MKFTLSFQCYSNFFVSVEINLSLFCLYLPKTSLIGFLVWFINCFSSRLFVALKFKCYLPFAIYFFYFLLVPFARMNNEATALCSLFMFSPLKNVLERTNRRIVSFTFQALFLLHKIYHLLLFLCLLMKFK